MHIDKSAKLLSLIQRTLKNMYGPARLQELIEDLSSRDQAMFIINFIKPAPVKDEFERLDDESLQRLADMMTERSKRAYNE